MSPFALRDLGSNYQKAKAFSSVPFDKELTTNSICVPSTVQDIDIRTIKQQFIKVEITIKELPTIHSDE
ncbi:12071_t:CDS:2, partial [Gigaspora rosea]